VLFVLGLLVAGIALVPLATAGAQAPPSTVGGEQVTAPEGTSPPGGDVTCTNGATLDPDHGPPGTVVTVTTTFIGNCDDIAEVYFSSMSCTGQYALPDTEGNSFPMTVDPVTGAATGTFVAPPTEPDPPIPDATEPITVTVTCTLSNNQGSPPAEGFTGTTYYFPPSTFTLELFADPDGDQPTLVEDDEDDVVPPGAEDEGVVNATPTFTG
jgi:hypothetical protein